jgi:universal stress protein A
MNNSKPILVAINLSDEAEYIIDQAKAIAQQHENAPLVLLHVLHHTHDKTPKFFPIFADEARLKQTARQRLTELAKRLDPLEVETVVGIGRCWQVILQAAQAYKARLILLGSHTQHGLADMLGATPDRVLHHNMTYDALIVHARPQGYEAPATYKHILVATDFSPASEKAAEKAAQWTQQWHAQLTLLHVVEHFPVDESNEWITPEDQDPASYRESTAQASLENLAVHLQQENAHREVVFSIKAAKHEIARLAQERQIDLIVLGAHGIHGIQALLGSTVDGVLHQAKCDVLVVRAT